MHTSATKIRFWILLFTAISLVGCQVGPAASPTPTALPAATSTPALTESQQILLRGWAALEQEDWQSAFDHAEEALADDESLAEAYALRGLARQHFDTLDLVLADLEFAWDNGYTDPTLQTTLAELYHAEILRLVEVEAYRNWFSYSITNALDAARVHYDNLLRIAPAYPELAALDAYLGPTIGPADLPQPEDPVALDNYHWARERLDFGDHPGALRHILEAAAKDVENPAIIFLFAEILHAIGDPELAAPVLRGLTKEYPLLLPAWRLYAQSAMEANLYSQARQAMIRTLLFDPNDETTEDNLRWMTTFSDTYTDRQFKKYGFALMMWNRTGFANRSETVTAESGTVFADDSEDTALFHWQTLSEVPENEAEFLVETMDAFVAEQSNIELKAEPLFYSYMEVNALIQFYSPARTVRSGALVVFTCEDRLFQIKFDFRFMSFGEVFEYLNVLLDTFTCSLPE